MTLVIGPGTEVIAGEGSIVTAGGIDSHIHFICPQQIDEALCSGVTTMLGGVLALQRAPMPQRARRPFGIWRACWKRQKACR